VTERQTEIDVAAARQLGLDVDEELVWLAREQRVPVYLGDCSEQEPSADTFMSLSFELDQILHLEDVPFMPQPGGVGCLQRLGYRVLVDFQTEDGAVAGRFYLVLARRARLDVGAGRDELCAYRALPDLRNFRGTAAVAIDRARPHWGLMDVTLCLSETGSWGELHSHVEYADAGSPFIDKTAVARWPPSGELTSCGPAPDETPHPVALDDYRGSTLTPTVGIQVRADAVEPAVDVELTVRIDGETLSDGAVTAGTLLDLGSWGPGAVVEAAVRNVNGAGQVRSNILGNRRFLVSAGCSEPGCLASGRYTVAYPGYPSDD
jgi:hypothetical protein